MNKIIFQHSLNMMKESNTKAYKIRTDVLSIKQNLIDAIEIPPEITHSAKGVRKRANPIKSLNPI